MNVRLLAALLQGLSLDAVAYKQSTHALITRQAVLQSVLSQSGTPNNPSTLDNLGLQYPFNSPEQTFPNSVVPDPKRGLESGNHRIDKLFEDGAIFEDSNTGHRSVNHFFDPTTGNPLNDACGTLARLAISVTTSPSWALEDKGPISGQDYSYADAHKYFYNALTLPSKSDRDQNWGKLFQTLGQISHLIEDMAQPQHVRNDSHLDQYPVLCSDFRLIRASTQASMRVTVRTMRKPCLTPRQFSAPPRRL